MHDPGFADEAYAHEMDRQDELAGFRERFYVAADGVYLDGNSLGLLSRDSESSLLAAVESWKALGVRGWMHADPPWFTLAEELGARKAALVGADPESVIVTGSTTTNLHQMVATFYKPEGIRRKIVATSLDFPSDVYALQSQILLRGGDPERDLILVGSRDGRLVEEDDIIGAMSEEAALVLLPSVLYRSGQLLDLEKLTAAAHERGIVIGFDCAHSVGVIPHQFDTWGVDFAVWCTYKYLNAGPGAVGSLYVHPRHRGMRPALAGWWGYRKDRQFEMAHRWEGAQTAGAFQISTVPLLATATLLGTMSIFEEAGIERIRAKSLALTDYLMRLVEMSGLTAPEYGYEIGTPSEHARRGGHVAIEHEHAGPIGAALIERNIIVDFRPPNVVRMAPIALYTSFHDVWTAVQALREVVDAGAHLRQYAGSIVT